MSKILIVCCSLVVIVGCKTLLPTADFSTESNGVEPDYSSMDCWAAHPSKKDFSDKFPKNFKADTSLSGIDVFFIYPTIYLSGKKWNAEIDDKKLNRKISRSTIKFQASVFNQLANVYSPLYRQMHLQGYKNPVNGIKALDFAYQDVKKAFKYYLNHLNKGNKIIIAAHSQGTNHAERLLKEYILNTDSISEKVIFAYLIGMPIEEFSSTFKHCENPYELNCFVSWRTFTSGYYPAYKYGEQITSTNPITWKSDNNKSEYNSHEGILMPGNKIRFKNTVSAQAIDGLLWIEFQNIPLGKWKQKKNYHIADYNLFWNNIRTNFIQRMTK